MVQRRTLTVLIATLLNGDARSSVAALRRE